MNFTVNLDTIILYVSDIEKLKSFYTGIFGLSVTEEFPGQWVLLNAGRCNIGLHRMGDAYQPENKESFKVNSNSKVVFYIDEDIRIVRDHLVSQKVTMRKLKTFDGYPYLLCDGEDPEGNVFQLKQIKTGL
ncbi:MAG TPA: VOC family protein [Mucilaginibacter sp.]|nr:VOC family protein [Mucilaginibacter sp.]